MAYRAEIEIAVRGARQLQELNNRIESTSNSIDEINRVLARVSQGTVASFSELSRSLRDAQQNFNDAARGTSTYGRALDDLLAAERSYNTELRERNRLLNNARAAQEASQRVITPGSTGFSSSQYGPAAPPSLIRGGQVQQSWGRFFSEAEEVAKELQNTANTRQGLIKKSWNRFFSEAEEVAKELQNTANIRQGLIKKSWNRFFIEAAEVAQDLRSTADARQGVIKQSWNRFFNEAAEVAKDLKNTASQARTRRRKEALGSAIIGGAFPLLFGQGVGAAVGGGAGGAAGGLIGGQFGFGLSLVGTALGTSFDALIEGAKELGAALNPLTADISAITKASGLSGSKLEKLILDLEKTGDAAGALSLATKELEKVVGQRGVEALKEFSQTTQDLSNDFEVFLTKFKAFMADVFNTLIVPRAEVELKRRGETIAAARKSTDPQIQSAIRELDDASSIEERVAAQDKILRLVEAEVEAKKVSVQIDRDSIQIANMQIALEEGLLEVERLGADIKDKSVQKQLEINLKLQYTIEQQKLINQLRSDEADFLVITAKLQGLQVKYQKELAALQNRINRPTGGGRGAKPPESKALSLQRDILRERLNLFNVDEQIARVGLDRLDILQREEKAILVRRDTEIELLEFARQDALNKNKVKEDETLINKLYDARLAKVIKSAELAAKENALTQERLFAEQQIAGLRAAAGFDPLALAERTQPFASRGIYGAPEGLMDFSTGAELNAIVKQEVALARVLEKYQEIGQAAQLTSELVTTGFLDMVTGTKSVEEVFADFLRNLAEMLMKTAQQMIAQYIAIGIARAFALGQSPSIGTRASDFNLTGFGPLESIGGNVFAGFADGGNPPVGRPSIVGERGPELFVPKSSGTIVPNHALGGGGVKVEAINITVENTGESLSPKAQKQIAGQVQGIVLSTLANERRSGGML